MSLRQSSALTLVPAFLRRVVDEERNRHRRADLDEMLEHHAGGGVQ
jgi:hypothetical protein